MYVTEQQPHFRFHKDGDAPPPDAIFVFGSNLAGRHGKGAALAAVRAHGARHGQGVGPQGRSYAIPTKGTRLEVLPLPVISGHIEAFLAHARAHPEQTFFVTRVGCGLAGYADSDIAPLFAAAPETCSFASQWRPYLAPQLRAAARALRRP